MLELDSNLASRAAARLAHIERALQKIDDGTYGISDGSGKLIPVERLDAVPEAIYTLDEQQARAPPVGSRQSAGLRGSHGRGRARGSIHEDDAHRVSLNDRRHAANGAGRGGGRPRRARMHVSMLQAAEANASHVLAADGYVFATPENLAAMSGG